jgi:hypothetical protein
MAIGTAAKGQVNGAGIGDWCTVLFGDVVGSDGLVFLHGDGIGWKKGRSELSVVIVMTGIWLCWQYRILG